MADQGAKESKESHKSLESPKSPDVAEVPQSKDDGAKSTSSSKRSRASVASSVRLREAKVKQELAKRKKDQAKKEMELRRKQLELTEELEQVKIDNELENANIEAAMWQDEVNAQAEGSLHEDSIPAAIKEPVDLSKRTEEWCRDGGNHIPGVEPQLPLFGASPVTNDNKNTKPELQDVLLMQMNLPKPSIPKFSGDPIEYWGFINSFEVNIARRLKDDRSILSYLIQFCEGKAHAAIENCILLDPVMGYKRAREILYDQFGRSHVVAQAHINKVLNRSPLRSNDADGLWDLARDMRRCQMTLTQMSYAADMSSTDNLLKVQELLPVHIQSKWAIMAHGLMENKVRPNFSHMTEFVEDKAKVASNVYGKHVGRAQKPQMTGPPKKPREHRAAFSTQEEDTQHVGATKKTSCHLCNKEHALEDCHEFKAKPVVERLVFVRQTGLCFNCLKRSHRARACRSQARCAKAGCNWKHNTLLHSERRDSSSQLTPGQQSGAGRTQNTTTEATVNSSQVCSNLTTKRRVSLRVLQVKVKYQDREVKTWALLDDGSDVSLCEQSLADDLGITGKMKSFSLTTVNNQGANTKGMETSIVIRAVTGGEDIDIPKAWTIDRLPISDRSIPKREDIDAWPHLRGIDLHTANSADIRLLVGSDTPEAFWVMEERRGRKKEPYAIRTPLGWTLMGPTSKSNDDTSFQVNHIAANETLDTQVQRFWELDYVIGDHGGGAGHSVEDKKALTIMDNTAHLIDGHYQIGLPWRHSPPKLPNNRRYAQTRLCQLERRLRKDESLHAQYKKTMSDYIEKGHAEEVDDSQKLPESEAIWYLPHHPVTHPMKPEKVRVVFDCAAKYKGVSLNSQLLQGPDFTNKLVGVLMRFRQEAVAFTSDIEGMFHQVKVPSCDADSLRFLWWKDGILERQPKEYRMQVHLFGATSSPSCAGYALRKTVEHNNEEFDDDVKETVLKNSYVDDCLKSVPSTEGGKRLIRGLRELLKQGGFRLTKWASNDKVILADIPPNERAASVVDLDLDHLPIERTLGVWWDMETDAFSFKVRPKDIPMTRRGLLSATSSLYDPLGFVAPFVLKAKILLQDLCAVGNGWDEPIGEEEAQRWQEWIDELPLLTSVQVNRCYKWPESVEEGFELHIFCDASERAYAACAYMRSTSKERETSLFVCDGQDKVMPSEEANHTQARIMRSRIGSQAGSDCPGRSYPANTKCDILV